MRAFLRAMTLSLLMLAVCAGLWAHHLRVQHQARAFELLKSQDLFAIGGIGIAGIESGGERSLRYVLSEPKKQAIADLERLYAESETLEGKAYALAGLHTLAPQRFEALAAQAPHGMLQTARGCIVQPLSFDNLLQEIRSGVDDTRPQSWTML
ncbi:hypothetical protein ACFQBQ_08610 [Granulicella cerasi]|uniref:Uncharacterized protein n=1 Tax=Granulicella cerasi TaxID=741063 RepID=A0ABW1ZA98_9BACT|nr:hypothetical protein [Granulicella cerasi]